MLQHDHGTVLNRIRFAEAEAENTGRRIRALRHDLIIAKTRESSMSAHVFLTHLSGIEKDVRDAEGKYFTLTGERLPAEVA